MSDPNKIDLQDALQRIAVEATALGADKCPPAPHACHACEILHLANYAAVLDKHLQEAHAKLAEAEKERAERQDHFPALMDLMRLINTECDRAGIPGEQLAPNGKCMMTILPQVRLTMLANELATVKAERDRLENVEKERDALLAQLKGTGHVPYLERMTELDNQRIAEKRRADAWQQEWKKTIDRIAGPTNEKAARRVAEQILESLNNWRRKRLPGPFIVDSSIDGESFVVAIKNAISARTDELEAQLAAASQDARRYQFIRSADWFDGQIEIIHGINSSWPESLDAAIDAALAPATGETK